MTANLPISSFRSQYRTGLVRPCGELDICIQISVTRYFEQLQIEESRKEQTRGEKRNVISE
jgi:hypothetical protein